MWRCPSDFDNFTALADRDYSDVSPAAAGHALLLQEEMYAEGFIGYQAEWWHYSDSDSYEIKETLEEAPIVNITSETASTTHQTRGPPFCSPSPPAARPPSWTTWAAGCSCAGRAHTDI